MNDRSSLAGEMLAAKGITPVSVFDACVATERLRAAARRQNRPTKQYGVQISGAAETGEVD